MKKNLPEIVFGGGDSINSQRVQRQVKSGELRKLAPRVYTSNFSDSDELIVKRNLYLILGHLFTGALFSHRTALEGKPTTSGEIFLTSSYSRRVSLPGITVRLMKGPEPQKDDMPFHGMYMSSQPRAFLENLQISRERSSTPKTLTKAQVEDRLERICKIRGEDALNQFRDKARKLAPALGMEREFLKLDKIIGAILRTKPADELSSELAKARSEGAPYDADRVELFNELFSSLVATDLPSRKEPDLHEQQVQTLAFFEAYFSNFIEGTEFEIEEAHEIVFENLIPPERPDDAHDILGTYRVVSNRQDMRREAASFDDFVAWMKAQHFTIMESRPEKRPGEFKEKPNRAGSTVFVEPELVCGTLRQGFELARATEPGLARAIFLMFLVAEVHPFEDGNGRIARVMMNAELLRAGLHPVIIPIVYRNDYIRGLKQLTHSKRSAALIRMIDFAQRFVSELPFSSYEETLSVLTECHAFRDVDEGHLLLPSHLPKSPGRS